MIVNNANGTVSWRPDRWHTGRAWNGHDIEDACPCKQEPCGLIWRHTPGCNQHDPVFARTTRQAHPESECPGAMEQHSEEPASMGVTQDAEGRCTACGGRSALGSKGDIYWCCQELRAAMDPHTKGNQ